MELKDLKITWAKLASNTHLDEEELKSMIGDRTMNLIERIDRNIKIGFGVLFVFISIAIIDDLIITPQLLEGAGENLSIPGWLSFLGVFSNVLILTTFIYFAIKYYHVRKSCDIACNLKGTLLKIIDTLKIYQRMFYLALITLLVTMGSGFIFGIYNGILDGVQQKGAAFSDIETNKLILAVFISIVILIIFVGAIFIFFHWGFRKLYGNYIHKLRQTLKELDEIND